MITSEQNEALILDQVRGREFAGLALELLGPELKQRPTRALVAAFCAWIRKQLLGLKLCGACEAGRHDHCGKQVSAAGIECECMVCWGTPQTHRISRRVQGRDAAAEAWELYQGELGGGGTPDPETSEAFVEELARRFGLLTPDLERAAAKAELEPIARLGATVIGYGEFANQQYDSIPRERLDWYLRKAEENAAALRAYLNHPELESWRRGRRGVDN
jgi:hypothetical protein